MIEASFEGDDIQIAFNPQYLLDGLTALDSDIARISFTESGKPAVITGKPAEDEQPDYRYLLMPIRLAPADASAHQPRSLSCAPDPPRAHRLPVLRRGGPEPRPGGEHADRPERAGQDQPGRGRRLRRHAGQPPGRARTRRWSGQGAERAIVRAAVTRAERDTWSRSRSTRAGPTGPG